MRNITKISIAVFCAGVMLSGIGTGVAIAEYTSLEYTGVHNLDGGSMKTESMDVTVIPEEGKVIQVMESRYTSNVQCKYDEAIPMNTVRYQITYNSEMVIPQVRYYKCTKEEQEYQQSEGEIPCQGRVDWYFNYIGNDFDLLMKNKDLILNDLKQGKIGSYQTRNNESVVIWMNPEMEDFVQLY